MLSTKCGENSGKHCTLQSKFCQTKLKYVFLLLLYNQLFHMNASSLLWHRTHIQVFKQNYRCLFSFHMKPGNICELPKEVKRLTCSSLHCKYLGTARSQISLQ